MAVPAEALDPLLDADPLPPLSATVDPAEAADAAVARLDAVSALVSKRLELELKHKSPDMRVVEKLTSTAVLTARELTRMRPPPTLDPELDPTNLAARDDLRARLEQMVTAAEAQP